MKAPPTVHPTQYWHRLDDGRIQCDVCPRECRMHEGQRGLCFVRGVEAGEVKLYTYGRSSGFCVDPIEKKPLNHFLPGTSVLSFGTAGCNLACKFCFHPDTLVATTRGTKRIADLFDECERTAPHEHGRIGLPESLEVWTRESRPARVAKVFAHPHSGELLSLRASRCPPVLLTANHKVFAAHRTDPDAIVKIEAGKLTQDHYLIVPKNQAGAEAKEPPDVADTPGTMTLETDRYEPRPSADPERTQWLDAGDKFLVPLLRIERALYEGWVYNLEVDDPDHSYLVPSLAVANCQNWDMSKSREMDTLADQASPEMLAAAARRLGCASVAFTYNDPVVFMEYAMDVADACRAVGVRSVAVTAGYISSAPRVEFYKYMDAANVDLKGFTERFYKKICGAELGPVLETLEYLKSQPKVWFEITTLLIPEENDSDAELDQMTRWIMDKLGPDVPLHFTAFHPDWKMLDKQRTPAATLTRARNMALANGLRYVYTGNVHDTAGASTYCAGCQKRVIERDWYELGEWRLDAQGRCSNCGTQLPGVFDGAAGSWGAKRMSVRLAGYEP